MKRSINIIAFVLAAFITTAAWAKDDKTKLEELMRSDSADINALASYPDSTRHQILEASTESKGLEKLNDVQKKTNEDFKNVISSYSKDDQQKIWNLTRYDNLISQLVTGGQKSKDQVEELLKNYPADVHDDALNFGVNHYDVLVKINDENVKFSDSYNDIVKDFPVEKQAAYNDLMKLPEVLSIMTGNIKMTSELGDIYKSDPALVKQEFDSLNLQMARLKAQDTQAWEDSLKNNPEAMTEMQASAKDYAKSNGYSGSDYSTDPQVVASYHPRPYPYWAGYPYWYGVDYWYPNPYWYDAGFYFWGGSVVFIGVPTYHFAYWGFNHYPHYFNRYPHLSNLYFNRYYGSRGGVIYNSNSRYTARVVNNWSARNAGSLPRGFLANDPNRVARIQELGKMETERRQYNRANPAAKVNRQDFINQRGANYPHIQSAAGSGMRTSPSSRPGFAPQGQQRNASAPSPAYSSPQQGRIYRGYNNAEQGGPSSRPQQSQGRPQMQQPRQQAPQQRPQMQAQPHQMPRSEPAQRNSESSHEAGGRRR